MQITLDNKDIAKAIKVYLEQNLTSNVSVEKVSCKKGVGIEAVVQLETPINEQENKNN